MFRTTFYLLLSSYNCQDANTNRQLYIIGFQAIVNYLDVEEDRDILKDCDKYFLNI